VFWVQVPAPAPQGTYRNSKHVQAAAVALGTKAAGLGLSKLQMLLDDTEGGTSPEIQNEVLTLASLRDIVTPGKEAIHIFAFRHLILLQTSVQSNLGGQLVVVLEMVVKLAWV
jgi:hypothetical protein